MTLKKSSFNNIYKLLIQNWENVFWTIDENLTLDILTEIANSGDRSNKKTSDFHYSGVIENYYENKKWTTDHLFQKQLEIFDSNDVFFEFIIQLLRPELFENYDSINELSYLVNKEIGYFKRYLNIVEYDKFGLPIFEILEAKQSVKPLPNGMRLNRIPFYVQKQGLKKIEEKEYFKLTPDMTWNDFSIYSIFELSYHNSKGSFRIGTTKIVHEEGTITWEYLPGKFDGLGPRFCSLSGSENFYLYLKKEFGLETTISILFALRDAAFFLENYDRFSHKTNFRKSLIRENDSERMLRQLRPLLNGSVLDELYSFTYDFKPAYAKDPINISLNFDNKEPLPNRIIAIIGENGTGKTQLLNSLPHSLCKGEVKKFNNKIPNFSKIIAISYSVFDNFDVPSNNVNFDYVYCGLKDADGDMRSDKGLLLSFHNNWKKIEEQKRIRNWKSVLLTFLDSEIVNELIKTSEGSEEYDVKASNYHEIKHKLSSGQSILLFIITQVIANIRFDSLIIYDEPETHLHPNAISDLMNMIYQLVDEFESFCLIATHSPIVIRELFSKNVFIMEKFENIPSLKRIGIESFGENLGILTEEVFGDRGAEKHYKKIIKGLVKKGYSFDEIIRLLKFDEVPVSLNTKIFIKSLIPTE